MTDKRMAHIRRRSEDLTSALGFSDAKAGFQDLFVRIRGSPFLLGETGNRAWKADVDWVLTESNFLKIFEGKYAKDDKQVLSFARR